MSLCSFLVSSGSGCHRATRTRPAAVMAVLLTLLPSGLLAQPPPERPTFRAGIDLIEIDVTVVNGQGVPVKDLRAPEFTVSVDGQRRSVVTAEFIDLRAETPEARPASADAGEGFYSSFYLGACYAVGGRDREAATQWRRALLATETAPVEHSTLADALFRTGESREAIALLRGALSVWPEDDTLLKRLAIALAFELKYGEALAVIEPYVERHPTDHEVLLLALVTMFSGHVDGSVINDNYFGRSTTMRLAGWWAARCACETACFPLGGRVGNRRAGAAIAREADGREDGGGGRGGRGDGRADGAPLAARGLAIGGEGAADVADAGGSVCGRVAVGGGASVGGRRGGAAAGADAVRVAL